MEARQPRQEHERLDEALHFVDQGELDEAPAWEQVEEGRFMPRRIRGSYRGRALG
jgi:hypothetical protein